MKISLRHRYKSHRDGLTLDPGELTDLACHTASYLVHGHDERARAESEQLRKLFGTLVDRLLARKLVDTADLAAIFNDLGEWEIALNSTSVGDELLSYARRQLPLATASHVRQWWEAEIAIAVDKLAHDPDWRPLWWQTRLLAGDDWWRT